MPDDDALSEAAVVVVRNEDAVDPAESFVAVTTRDV